jgi:phage gp16-like protein
MDQGQAKNTENKRNKLIKLIHIGKAKMGLTDEAYRAFLEGVAGKQSCADMTGRQLEAALRAMRRNGFDNAPRRVKPEEQGQATMAQLEYIRGLWQNCARNRSDAALLAFVNRVAHVKALRFLTVHTAQKVILALRDMSAKAAAKAAVKAGYAPGASEAPDG